MNVLGFSGPRKEVATMLYLISLGAVCIMVLVVVAYSRSYSEPRLEQDDPFRRCSRLEDHPDVNFSNSDSGSCSIGGDGAGGACVGSGF